MTDVSSRTQGKLSARVDNKMSNAGGNQRLVELRTRLQSQPQYWNGEDVVEWLRYIGLEQYAPNFSQLKIDGYLILDLTEEDLEGELQVTVKLHRKKIMKAIQELRLLEQPEAVKSKQSVQGATTEVAGANVQARTRPVEPLCVAQPSAPAPAPAASPRRTPSLAEAPYINVVSLEGPTDVNYHVSSEPVSIGRHSSNQISIIDESVSRHHAKIECDGAKFSLKDIGSTTGTFIKIQEPLQVREDMIIEIGSYQFQVSFIHIARGYGEEESHIELTVYESPDEMSDKYLIYSESSIGRKSSCTLSFPDDLHMSNLHCKFNLIGDRFIFEDMASTNGSWLRLSKEGTTSAPYPLDRNAVFKIGNTAMYEVRLPSKRLNEETKVNAGSATVVAEKCSICWDNERDCLIMPCRHNVSCTKCIKSVKFCPFCREYIKDIIKIYK